MTSLTQEIISSYKNVLEEHISSEILPNLSMMLGAKKNLKSSKITKSKTVVDYFVHNWDSFPEGKKVNLKKALLWLTENSFLGLQVSMFYVKRNY